MTTEEILKELITEQALFLANRINKLFLSGKMSDKDKHMVLDVFLGGYIESCRFNLVEIGKDLNDCIDIYENFEFYEKNTSEEI